MFVGGSPPTFLLLSVTYYSHIVRLIEDFKMKTYNVWAAGSLVAEGVSLEQAYDLHSLWTIVYNAPCSVQEVK
jgi:hypothetical protein